MCWEGVQRAGCPTASHSPAECALECLLHLALLLTSVAVSPGASVSCYSCCEVGIKIVLPSFSQWEAEMQLNYLLSVAGNMFLFGNLSLELVGVQPRGLH